MNLINVVTRHLNDPNDSAGASLRLYLSPTIAGAGDCWRRRLSATSMPVWASLPAGLLRLKVGCINSRGPFLATKQICVSHGLQQQSRRFGRWLQANGNHGDGFFPAN